MNNHELELKIREILSTNNFFDALEKTINFEKEYKASGFFKKTKMPLLEVIKYSKEWYLLDANEIVNKIQSIIDKLDFTKINEILNQFGDIFTQENEETLSIIKEFQNIVGK